MVLRTQLTWLPSNLTYRMHAVSLSRTPAASRVRKGSVLGAPHFLPHINKIFHIIRQDNSFLFVDGI